MDLERFHFIVMGQDLLDDTYIQIQEHICNFASAQLCFDSSVMDFDALGGVI